MCRRTFAPRQVEARSPLLPSGAACRRGLLWLSLLSLVATSAQAAPRPAWRHVFTEDGVRVSARDIPGQDFPEFRGVTVLNCGIFDLLAILDDAPRHCEWQASCKVMRIIKKYNEFDRLMYHRLDSPWPVSDRDMVFKGSVTVDPVRKIVRSPFRAVRGHVPPKSGVVRMTKMRGFFKFELLKPGQIRTTYQVYSDPGGWLPAWLVKAASRKIPLHTLQGLRRQLKKTKGRYSAFHKRYNPEQGGTIPARFQPKKAAPANAAPPVRTKPTPPAAPPRPAPTR